MNTIIMAFFKSNPKLMSRLCQGHKIDIGDGLEIVLANHATYRVGNRTHDRLDFSFFLEGKRIGWLEMPQDINFSVDGFFLMCQVADRLKELFPCIDILTTIVQEEWCNLVDVTIQQDEGNNDIVVKAVDEYHSCVVFINENGDLEEY